MKCVCFHRKQQNCVFHCEIKLFEKKKKLSNKKMFKKMDKMWLLYGLTLVTFLTIVNCTDPELSMEAAFQGELNF